jgi:peroxiredoxin
VPAIVFAVALMLSSLGATAAAPEAIAPRDSTVIAEAYHLWQSLGEAVWPGWTDAPMPLVYVTGDREVAVGFGSVPEGFEAVDQRIAARAVALRDRVLDTDLAAAYDFQGTPAVVIGMPENLEWSPTRWALKAVHEMFHVLSMQRGSAEKIRALEIGPDDDASWHIDFPFPYNDINVMRLMHLQGYPLYLAVADDQDDERGVKYDAGTALEATEVLKAYLLATTGDERAARYAMFQEGEEGAGRYTEYTMAKLAARREYEPLAGFRVLDGYESYATVWEEDYAPEVFVIKHAGRAVKTRTVFYYIGLGKCLLLDRLDPDWKHAYFAPGVWLDDLIAAAVGSRTTLAPIASGTAAPEFDLRSLDGTSVRFAGPEGSVVLLDFWQWWCPPCLQAMPHLQALADAYGARGLKVLGISDRVGDDARRKMREVKERTGAAYPMLVDPSGAVVRAYGVNSYPTHILIDRTGTVRWTGAGFSEGDERLIEERIVELLGR